MLKKKLMKILGLKEDFDSSSVVSEEDFIGVLMKFMEDKYTSRLSTSSHAYSGAKSSASGQWGVTKAMVSKVMKGIKPPTKAMLDDIKYDKRTVTFYVKKSEIE